MHGRIQPPPPPPLGPNFRDPGPLSKIPQSAPAVYYKAYILTHGRNNLSVLLGTPDHLSGGKQYPRRPRSRGIKLLLQLSLFLQLSLSEKVTLTTTVQIFSIIKTTTTVKKTFYSCRQDFFDFCYSCRRFYSCRCFYSCRRNKRCMIASLPHVSSEI